MSRWNPFTQRNHILAVHHHLAFEADAVRGVGRSKHLEIPGNRSFHESPQGRRKDILQRRDCGFSRCPRTCGRSPPVTRSPEKSTVPLPASQFRLLKHHPAPARKAPRDSRFQDLRSQFWLKRPSLETDAASRYRCAAFSVKLDSIDPCVRSEISPAQRGIGHFKGVRTSIFSDFRNNDFGELVRRIPHRSLPPADRDPALRSR